MPPAELPIEAIGCCTSDPAFVATVERLYADLDRRIAARHPVCTNRGHCCHFDRFGHRLFVTPAELGYFLTRATEPVRSADPRRPCPYQVDGRCTARTRRPTGCRIFFCDPAHQEWQGPETEETLRRLRKIHERFDLPYAYVEWRAALQTLALQARRLDPQTRRSES